MAEDYITGVFIKFTEQNHRLYALFKKTHNYTYIHVQVDRVKIGKSSSYYKTILNKKVNIVLDKRQRVIKIK